MSEHAVRELHSIPRFVRKFEPFDQQLACIAQSHSSSRSTVCQRSSFACGWSLHMAFNDKSSVTKEQNDQNRKVLEGLMKLPENRECADCKSKGPRWASVNLGLFVCIQCSGIHRSLGVHISKVRSATLDTWLPEQVTFMQGMGNAKANAFWEAELPTSFRRPNENDRGGLESFIRSKYEARRWVPKIDRSPAKVHDKRRTSANRPSRSPDNGKQMNGSSNISKNDVKGHGASEGSEPRTHENGGKHHEASQSSNSSTQHAVASSAFPVSEPSPSKKNSRNVLVLPATKPPQNPLHPVQATPISKGHKIEAPTDLFDLLSIEEPSKADDIGAASSTSDDQGWAAFQFAAAESSVVAEAVDRAAPTCSEPSACSSSCDCSTKADIIAGLEDLFKGSPAVSSASADVTQPRKELKEDILSLFSKTSMAFPYAAHQQHMAALLEERQSMIMAAAVGSGMKMPVVTAETQTTPDFSAASRKPISWSTWPDHNSVMAGSVNSSGAHCGDSQIGAAYHRPPSVQACVSTSSLSGGTHGTTSPFESLVSSSLTSLNASSLAGNGSSNRAKKTSLLGFNSLYSNRAGQELSNKPDNSATLDMSSVSTGATYDFSALTFAALSKQ